MDIDELLAGFMENQPYYLKAEVPAYTYRTIAPDY
jgi:TRAP-type uncharacterized transport system substrate-binding protein